VGAPFARDPSVIQLRKIPEKISVQHLVRGCAVFELARPYDNVVGSYCFDGKVRMNSEKADVVWGSARGSVPTLLRRIQESRTPVRKRITRAALFAGLDATHSGTRARTPWALLCGDAETRLKGLPDCCVDCVVTSPPYYWQRDYHIAGQSGQEESLDDYVLNLLQVFREVRRVLKPSGLLFLNLGDKAREAGLAGTRHTVSRHFVGFHFGD
jgi:SAM-dependent methyltransferase